MTDLLTGAFLIENGVPIIGAGLTDAPIDGTTYGRRDAAWVPVSTSAEGFIGQQIINDSTGPQSLTAGIFVSLTNDGLGAGTANFLAAPLGLWDTITNQFDFAGLIAQTDALAMVMQGVVRNVVNNVVITLRLRLRIGGVEQYLDFELPSFDAGAGDTSVAIPFPAILPITDADLIARPGDIQMMSNASGSSFNFQSLIIYGWRRS